MKAAGLLIHHCAAPIKIVDVGCALVDGETPFYQPLIDLPYCEILGFDGDQQACVAFRDRLGSAVRVRCEACYLGNGARRTLHICKVPTTSSLLRPNAELMNLFDGMKEALEVERILEVPTSRLDQFEATHDADLIKTDAQGADLEILCSANRALTSSTVIDIEVEFIPQYKGQPLFAEIDQFLRRNGFLFHTFRTLGSRPLSGFPHWDRSSRRGFRQVIWGNAVYARNIERMTDLPSAKLAAMALIMATCYRSFDFVRLLVAILDARQGSTTLAALDEELNKTYI